MGLVRRFSRPLTYFLRTDAPSSCTTGHSCFDVGVVARIGPQVAKSSEVLPLPGSEVIGPKWLEGPRQPAAIYDPLAQMRGGGLVRALTATFSPPRKWPNKGQILGNGSVISLPEDRLAASSSASAAILMLPDTRRVWSKSRIWRKGRTRSSGACRTGGVPPGAQGPTGPRRR